MVDTTDNLLIGHIAEGEELNEEITSAMAEKHEKKEVDT